MATSGPITYLVMADQFLSVAARHKRLPQTTATSSPLIGISRDQTVTFGGPDDRAALAEAVGPDGIHVIIDYLWGQPTEAVIAAITRRGLAHTAPRVRLVEVGQMAGPTISLPADVLRSSGLEILGSGPGTIPLAEITGAIPEFMSLAATSDLPIDIDEVPLAEVEPAWHRRSGGRRIVFRP